MNVLRACIALLALLGASAGASARAHDYRFDTVHTQILFSVSHLGFSRPSGLLHVKSGFIHFDAGDWSQSKVQAEIDLAGVDIGDATWNDKLRSGEFFDVSKRATAHFESVSVDKTGERTGVVHGKLTLLGMTRPVDLALTFNRAGVHAYSLHYVAGFSASAELKRSDFGMKKYLPDVGDAISVRIEAEGLRDRDAQEQAPPSEPEH